MIIFWLSLSDSSFLIQPTTEVEVEKYAETLKNHKANGPWSLPNKLFKQFKKCLKVPLAKLANLTIELGEFPEILKLPRLYWSIKKAKKLTAVTIDGFLWFATWAKS